jgi:hypothetical protein
MPHLSQMELNTIKELVALGDVNAKKFQLYAQNCQDVQLQSILNQESQKSFTNAKSLMGFLKS